MNYGRAILSFFLILFVSSAAVSAPLPVLNPLWKTATGGAIVDDGTVGEGGCSFLSEDKYIYTLDPATGAVIRKIYTAGKGTAGPMSLPGGNFLTVHPDDTAGVYNKKGVRVVQYFLPGRIIGRPIIDSRGIVYFCTREGSIISFTHTGRERWQLKIDTEVLSNPVLGADGKIFILTGDALLGISPVGSISRQPLPVYVEDNRGLLTLTQNKLVALFSDRLLKIDVEKKVLQTVQFPLYFGCSGGYRVTEKLLCLFGKDNEVLFYRIENSDITPVFSITLHLKTKIRGIVQHGNILIAGGSDWILYGYPLPPSLSTRSGSGGNAHDIQPPDRLFYTQLAQSGERKDIAFLLHEIEDEIENKTVGGDDLYILNLLEIIARGERKTETMDTRTYDAYADLRSQAVHLMGILGNLQTQSTCTDMLKREYHPDVQKALVHTLGLLRSDPGGKALAVIERINKINNTLHLDVSLTSEILFFLKAIQTYHGGISSELFYSSVYSIFRSAYPRQIRKTALHLMETK